MRSLTFACPVGARPFTSRAAAGLGLGLIVVHVGAALKHLIFDRDQVFQRMLPARPNG